MGKIKKQEYNNFTVYLASALAGFMAFMLIYGAAPLDVTYDGWILNGYVETDIAQHYSGWLAFLNSESFNFSSYSELIAYPFGGYTSVTDSIPLASIFFKAISAFMPQSFQFFGLVCCFNMIMQAVWGAKVMSLFTEDRVKMFLGGVLLCFSPVMIERMFRHTGLSFHWYILAAIYLYFKGHKNADVKISAAFTVLIVATVWTHLYFTPVVAGFFLAYVLDNSLAERKNIKHTAFFAAAMVLCFLSAKYLGVLDIGTSNNSGYGTMGMNLNALFNPVSLDTNWWVPGGGKMDWSAFLPIRALALNNIESFNYLGLGVIAAAFLLGINMVKRAVTEGKQFFVFIKDLAAQHIFLVLFLAFSTLFAVSNVVCAFSYVLFTVPLPQFLLNIFNSFRASGRLFWSVSYIIVTVCAVNIMQLFAKNRKLCITVMAAVVALQIADLTPVITQKHNEFQQIQVYHNQHNADSVLAFVADSKVVYFMELTDDRALCAGLLKEGKANNLLVINRGDYMIADHTEEIERVKTQLLDGTQPYSDCVYVTSDYNLAQEIAQINSFEMAEIDGRYYLKG